MRAYTGGSDHDRTRRSSLRDLVLGLFAAHGCGDDDEHPVVDAGRDGATVDGGTEAGSFSTDTPDGGGEAGPAATFALTILHTNDLHSHLWGHNPEADYTPATPNDDATVGGFARLATAIGTQKAMAQAAGNPVLLLDAGDFMMGTLFQLAATTNATELQLMQAVGYDASTLGNHEFDWTPRGLAAILKAAATKGVTLPLVASNLRFNPAAPEDDELEAFKDPGPHQDQAGEDAAKRAQGRLLRPARQPGPDLRALGQAADVRSHRHDGHGSVADLRANDHVDLVIALSHSGISEQGQGEDRALAAAVPGIDVIISGHTHQKLTQPVTVGTTLIVTAGAYGEYLGRLDLEVRKTGGAVSGVAVKGYQLLPIDDQTPGNPQTQAAVDSAVAGLDMALAPAGLSYKKAVAETSFDLLVPPFVETTVGDLVTDAFRATTTALDPTDPPALAVEANGQLRAPLFKGKTGVLWFSDLYRVTPIGIGPDGKPGYPLITYYLNGKDLKAGLEVGAGAMSPPLGDDAYFLQLSGLQADYKRSNPLFQRVTAARLVPPTGPPVAIDLTDTTKCYKVVTTLYLGALFSLVSTVSQGLLSVQAKEKDCQTPVTNLETHLVDAIPPPPASRSSSSTRRSSATSRSCPTPISTACPRCQPRTPRPRAASTRPPEKRGLDHANHRPPFRGAGCGRRRRMHARRRHRSSTGGDGVRSGRGPAARAGALLRGEGPDDRAYRLGARASPYPPIATTRRRCPRPSASSTSICNR